MYQTSDTRGRPAGVTAWLGLPKNITSTTPVISWGHGTTGMADSCAPTKTTAASQIPFFQSLLDEGYIVVATDYTYLGTPGPHPYFDAATMAYSMIDAAIAAQQFSGSDGPVVYAGYSIGGRGAIFAQSMSEQYAPQVEVVGSAAFRPGVDGLSDGGTLWKTLRDSPLKGYVVMAFYGVWLAWGNKYFELEEILTPMAIERLPLLDTDCRESIIDTFSELSGDEVFVLGLDDALPQGVIGPAEEISNHPLLLLAGRGDTTVAPEVIDSYFTEACDGGQSIELHWLNEGHDLSADFDEPIFLDWINGILLGNARTNSCDTGPIRPKLCRDSEKCFRITTAENLEGPVENPFEDVPGLAWELLFESNYGYACPVYGVACSENRTEGHISRIWKAEVPVSEADVETWLEEIYWTSVKAEWRLRLYEKDRTSGPPCGFYFQFLRYNNWGYAVIVPNGSVSDMYVFVTHQNRTTQPPMSDIPWRRYLPC